LGDGALTDQPLPRSFYERAVLDVARDLLGCIVLTEVVAVRLTEVEAYDGPDDPGSHAFRGPTPRTRIMFGPPGRAYVYFSYGMHWCLNLVCGPEGRPSAVLLRAGELSLPAEADVARRAAAARAVAERRPGIRPVDLARGPARLTRLLAVDREDNDADVTDPAGRLQVRPGAPVTEDRVRRGPRVGLSAAAERPWRFWIAGEPSVSPYRAGRPRGATSPKDPASPRDPMSMEGSEGARHPR
jgi:DNA-3-methyladenine glycosylase